MILAYCMLYILAIIDPQSATMYSGALLITGPLYYLAALLSTFLEEDFLNISIALYQSKWYLLATKERKMVLMILLMSQKSKTAKVGPVTNASLERFTGVSSIKS